jgi:hypothetical protein
LGRPANLRVTDEVKARVVLPNDRARRQQQLSGRALELGAVVRLRNRAVRVVLDTNRPRAVEVDVLAGRLVGEPLLEGARLHLGAVAEGREIRVVDEDVP